MPAHMRVVEVRTTISRITWIEKNAGEITVFQGPVTLHLHPGEQMVHLGAMNIPAGTYIGGVIYVGNVEVDIETDLALAGVPPDAYEEEYQNTQQRLGEGATNWSREVAIVKHTWNPGRRPAPCRWRRSLATQALEGRTSHLTSYWMKTAIQKASR